MLNFISSTFVRVVTCLIAMGVLGACSEDVGVGPDELLIVDPGRCLSAPELTRLGLGDPDLPVSAAAISCTHVAWLAPVSGPDGLSQDQVYVHDFAMNLTYRTTGPDEEGAFGDGPTRRAPTLHGFWLAYADETGVVVENLRDFERAFFSANVFPGSQVDIYYPWVVWIEAGDFGRSVVMAGHLEDGQVVTVTPPEATATSASVDDGRVVYTLWPEDLDGPFPALEGPSRVEVQTLGTAEPAMPIHPTDEDTLSPTLYDDLVAYVVVSGGEASVVSRTLSSGLAIGVLSGDGITAATRPQAGAHVITWLRDEPASDKIMAWWPHLDVADEWDLAGDASLFTIGEHVHVSNGSSDHALNLGLLYPRESPPLDATE